MAVLNFIYTVVGSAFLIIGLSPSVYEAMDINNSQSAQFLKLGKIYSFIGPMIDLASRASKNLNFYLPFSFFFKRTNLFLKHTVTTNILKQRKQRNGQILCLGKSSGIICTN